MWTVALSSLQEKGDNMRRLLLAGAVLAFPLAGLTVGLAGPASASVRNPSTGVSCTKVKGTITGTNAKLKGCSDVKNTGGSGKAPITALATGSGTITWNGTGTTTLTGGTFNQVTPDACPTGSTEYEAMLTVSGGTGAAAKSILVGWTVQAFVCVNGTTGKISLLPGTDLNIGASF
jgi:hypothetical protein